VDDAGAGTGFSVGCGPPNAPRTSSRGRNGQGASLLLSFALRPDPRGRHCHLLSALWLRTLDVRVRPGPLSVHGSASLGILAADCILAVVTDRCGDVSSLPLVRSAQTAPPRRLAELPVMSCLTCPVTGRRSDRAIRSGSPADKSTGTQFLPPPIGLRYPV